MKKNILNCLKNTFVQLIILITILISRPLVSNAVSNENEDVKNENITQIANKMTNEYNNKFITNNVENPKKQGTVTIRHQEYFGGELAESETITGNVGDSFETTPAYIYKYVPLDLSTNISGTFTEEDQTITYYYEYINYGVRKFIDSETEKAFSGTFKEIEAGLAKQPNKLGIFKGDSLEVEMSGNNWPIEVPEESPVLLSDHSRLSGRATPLFLSSGSLYFDMIDGKLLIERRVHQDFSDYLYCSGSSDYRFTVEQLNPRTGEWVKYDQDFTGTAPGSGFVNFTGYYEVAPKLELDVNDELVKIEKDSEFKFSPEEFFTELSSAGGVKSEFITIPDMSKVGKQTVEIRVWDQYVTEFGWDEIDEDYWDWDKNEKQINHEHYLIFEVPFEVIDN